MIHDFLRKHRRIILVFIIIFIGLPFIFFVPGVDTLFGGDPQAGNLPTVVGKVGSTPITSQAFLNEYNRLAEARSRNGVPPTANELVQQGAIDDIMEHLVGQALVARETEERNLQGDSDYLVEMLKKDQYFLTPEGEFDGAKWNAWVQSMAGANWNILYEELNRTLNQRVFGSLVTASARVPERELREKFKEQNTKLQIRYAAIEPPIEKTEEELRAYFEQNPANYNSPEERTAEFIKISLLPEATPVVDEVMEKALGGEDFQELAKQYSKGPTAPQGGDINWVTETATLPEHRQVLFSLNPGDVSEPVEGPDGTYIYQVYEERNSVLAGKRDVRAREIVLRPELDLIERENRLDQAQDIVVKAKESGDLAAAAQEAGLELFRTGPFSMESVEIENVDDADALIFRRQLQTLPKDGITEVIEARDNLYVAKVTDVIAPRPRPFEEVRDRVEEDAKNAAKLTDEYRERVTELVTRVKEEATSLADIQAKFPELTLEIKEPEPFSSTDFLFQQGIYWNAQQAFSLLSDTLPGEMDGPISDFTGTNYFLELVQRTEPDETVWETDYPAEKDALLDQVLAQRRSEWEQDYVQFLRERAEEQALVQQDYEAIGKIIGLDEATATQPASATEGEGSTGGYWHGDHWHDGPAPASEGTSPAGGAVSTSGESPIVVETSPTAPPEDAVSEVPALETPAVDPAAGATVPPDAEESESAAPESPTP